MSAFTLAKELWDWILSLQPDFAFLLALPFFVAFVGLLAECLRRPREKTRRQ